MKTAFTVVIPARFGASRLPGKPLLNIGNKTLIQHVYDAASMSKAERVIIATDDERIDDVARSFGAEVVMTSKVHQSGTDRLAEVVRRKEYSDNHIVVNVQGDEFNMSALHIDTAAEALISNDNVEMSTLAARIDSQEQLTDRNTVKVVCDKEGRALYFSRSPIPCAFNGKETATRSQGTLKHIGVYAYRAGFLRTFSELKECELEKTEKLEQLRALYYGYRIQVQLCTENEGIGIDTEEDLERARSIEGAVRS